MEPSERDPAERARRAARMDTLAVVAPTVQHEVNNALMVLNSNLDLLGRSAVEGPMRRQLDRATEAAKRLDRTMRGFLDVARRPSADMVTQPLPQVLAQIDPLLRVALGARIKLEVEAPEGLPSVPVDRARLDVALLAMARDTAQRHTTAGGRVLVELRREGAGITLVLRLPEGARASPYLLGLFGEVAEASSGRLSCTEDGNVLTLAFA